jgi:hypothetical protein
MPLNENLRLLARQNGIQGDRAADADSAHGSMATRQTCLALTWQNSYRYLVITTRPNLPASSFGFGIGIFGIWCRFNVR